MRKLAIFLRVAAAAGLVLSLAIVVWLAAEPDYHAGDFLARRGSLARCELEPERVETGGFVSQNVRLTADTGLQVELRVLRPAGAERRPLAVLLGGHRTGREAVQLLGSPGNLAIAALNYPYAGPDRPRGWRQILSAVLPARQALRDTPSAVLLAADWLLQQSWVDPSRVEVVGVSLGVPFAVVAAALEPRFNRLWCIHGGAGLREWTDHNLARRVPNGWWRNLLARVIHRAARGSLFEPENWIARVAPRPVVVIGARDDRRLPERLVERLHAAAAEPRELLWTEGDHVDRQPGSVRELVSLVLERMDAAAAPPGGIH